MNEGHEQFCASDEWRAELRTNILPSILGDTDLGSDLLEVGPGYGATTDYLRELVDRVTAVEIHPELAARLADRYAGTNVEITCGDATALDFDDDRFTGATSFFMLHHVPSPELARPPVRRVGAGPRGRAGSSSPPTAWPATASASSTTTTSTSRSIPPAWPIACRPPGSPRSTSASTRTRAGTRPPETQAGGLLVGMAGRLRRRGRGDRPTGHVLRPFARRRARRTCDLRAGASSPGRVAVNAQFVPPPIDPEPEVVLLRLFH